MQYNEIPSDDDISGGEWNWFNSATLEIENAPSEIFGALLGDAFPKDAPDRPVHITAPAKDSNGVRKIDFVLYKVQFKPFKFDYFNTWYKKLLCRILGKKRTYWLFYRNALTINYTGKALMSEAVPDEKKIGRLV